MESNRTESEKIQALISSFDEDVQLYFQKVLDIEKSKLYLENPYGIKEELINAIKELIREAS